MYGPGVGRNKAQHVDNNQRMGAKGWSRTQNLMHSNTMQNYHLL